jgi:hypothetical protein
MLMGRVTSYGCPSMTGVRSSFSTNQPAVFQDNTAITGALLAPASIHTAATVQDIAYAYSANTHRWFCMACMQCVLTASDGVIVVTRWLLPP